LLVTFPGATDAGTTDALSTSPLDAAQADTAEAGDDAQYAWEFLRIDDCSGLDDSTLGYSTGSDTPVAANCTAERLGRAAVCWDQVQYPNVQEGKAGCTYKTVPTTACTLGQQPGRLWICVDRQADAGAHDTTPSPAFGNWRYVGIGDCPGQDIASIGVTTPNLPLGVDCTALNRGYAAICWDQKYQSNSGLSAPGCTYKNVTPANCAGGSNPGFMYVCNAP
jgi:hypothetical protein